MERSMLTSFFLQDGQASLGADLRQGLPLQRMAMTDRAGDDASDMVLSVGHAHETTSAILGRPVAPDVPKLGTVVCAIGRAGWKYIGPVVSVDEAGMTYTVQVKTVIRPRYLSCLKGTP